MGCLELRRVAALSAVGNTPLVELPQMSPKDGVRIFAKLEDQNPTGSVKDRVALSMVEAAEASGELEPGRRLLEPTSGNTGIALAMIGKVKGYPVSVVMPESATPERVELLRMYGAEILFSPGELGSNGAVAMARGLAERDPSVYMPFQYANEANPSAHYCGTALEILEQVPDGQVDAFVAGLGTGGTLMGTGRRLREANPDVQIVAAEPLQGDPVMGLRSLEDGYTPPILDIRELDRKVLVSNVEAVLALRKLLELEGIFAGVSAGRGAGGRPPHRRRARGGLQRRHAVRGRRQQVHERRTLHPADRGSRAADGGARLVVIPAAMRDEIVAHAKAGLPNEACGIIAGLDGTAQRFFPAEPDAPSPYYYRISSEDQIRIMNEIDDAGLDLIGIYHSHVASPAYPVADRRRAGVLARCGLRDRLAGR